LVTARQNRWLKSVVGPGSSVFIIATACTLGNPRDAAFGPDCVNFFVSDDQPPCAPNGKPRRAFARYKLAALRSPTWASLDGSSGSGGTIGSAGSFFAARKVACGPQGMETH
jgi:hypothetical protein